MPKIAAAVQRATSRQALRDFLEGGEGIELDAMVPTGKSLLSRPTLGKLDHIILDGELIDLAQTLTELEARQLVSKVYVVTEDVNDVSGMPVRAGHVLRVDLRSATAGTELLRMLGIKQAMPERKGAGLSPAGAAPLSPAGAMGGFKRRELVVIGCSTGGPQALAEVLGAIPEDFPVPIVIVQHMPPDFTTMLAARLDKICPLKVREVTGPVTASRGEVWIAPGHRHLVLANSNGRLELDDGPEENNCKPAVDVLFRSAAMHYGRRTVGVVLTGMGDDGALGATRLTAAGGHVIVQDEETCVVWGMPGATFRAGAASEVLPLGGITDAICSQFSTRIGKMV